MTAGTFIVRALAGAILVLAPALAQAQTCRTAVKWQTGNNSDEEEQNIGRPGSDGMTLLEFRGPVADEGKAVGYTTFAAPIEGLVKGRKYRLNFVFERENNGVDREVSLSAAGLRPQSPVIFRQSRRQTFQKDYVADASRAVIMIHMKGFMKMYSFAGFPRLCRG